MKPTVTWERRTAAAGLALAAALALAGCHGNGNNSGASGGTPGTTVNGSGGGHVQTTLPNSLPAAPRPLFPSATVGNITDQMAGFWAGSATLTYRTEHLQEGTKFTPYFQKHMHDRAVQHRAATVSHVTFVDLQHAKFRLTVSENGKAVVKNFPADAYNHNAEWQLSAGTFCQVILKTGQPKPAVCP